MTHKSELAVLVGEALTSKAKGKGARRWKRKKGKGTAIATTSCTGGAPAAPTGKGKGKVGGSQRSRANDVCMHCQGMGHWKRECPQLLSNPSMFVVEVNMISNSASWVLDTGCGAHICNDLQVLERSRKDKEVGRLKESRNRQFGSSTNLRVLSKGKDDQEALCWTKRDCQRSIGLVHSDVCGPLSTPARGGFSYFITFTDDHSQYGYVYLMRYKSEAFGRFKVYRLEVESQTGRKMKALRSDRGGEYLSGEFIDYLKENGILSEWTPPGMQQLNGMAERRNRTLLDMVRSMMSFTELPPSFWGYPLETAAEFLNIAPSKTVPQTPYEIWHGKLASYKYIGYSKETVGYYFYDPVEQKIFNSRNAVFLEKDFPSDSRRDEVLFEESSEEPQHDSTTSFEPQVHTDGVPVLRRSTRKSRVPERYGFVGLTSQLDNNPKTYGEAMSDIDSDKWLEAMKFEMDSMGSNQVWTLVDLPKGVRPVGCKWVYKHKPGADGEVTAFKARLVEKGYTQRPGVDFEKTYSPVAMAKSIRILLAIAAWYDYEIWQMDVKMAFLNGFVEKKIFMDQLEGFTAVGEEQKVCHLQRSIYGLKQDSRSWNTCFDEVIRGYDFIKNYYDPCIYKKISGSSVAYLVLYVDDILPIRNDVKMLGDIKAWLSTQFSMKDMGEASYILGIKIYTDGSRRMLGLTQSSYIEKVLKRFKMEHSKRGLLPMRHGVKFSKKQSPKTDEELKRMLNFPYASAVGSIQ
ncbi:UNVERIFIED_CONTAM: Retrovirus-related Pol polyprotein from transposon TNT 1-94 [Sesamum latifolium]|uniref:Retrovirus-related Pol polyprotein from transposon TNT 1-94 n=1 Tax=Sesamum latifolium TaxID=2727402 RepID=A0AAW2XLE3_9LAMI